jgi:hypothetical protein
MIPVQEYFCKKEKSIILGNPATMPYPDIEQDYQSTNINEPALKF